MKVVNTSGSITIFILLLALISCTDYEVSKEVHLLSLDLTIGANQNDISFTLTVHNSTDKDIEVTYNNTQKFDFVVFNSEQDTVWRWSKDQIFQEVITCDTITSGNSFIFVDTWDKTNNIDTTQTTVPDGDYTVTGIYCGNDKEVTNTFIIQ